MTRRRPSDLDGLGCRGALVEGVTIAAVIMVSFLFVIGLWHG